MEGLALPAARRARHLQPAGRRGPRARGARRRRTHRTVRAIFGADRRARGPDLRARRAGEPEVAARRPAAQNRAAAGGSQGPRHGADLRDPSEHLRCRRCPRTASGPAAGCRCRPETRERRHAPRSTSSSSRSRRPAPEQRAATLSGGNQQKVVVGKWLHCGADILLFDEPTQGIDVLGKEEHLRRHDRPCRSGCGRPVHQLRIRRVLARVQSRPRDARGRNRGRVAGRRDVRGPNPRCLLQQQSDVSSVERKEEHPLMDQRHPSTSC